MRTTCAFVNHVSTQEPRRSQACIKSVVTTPDSNISNVHHSANRGARQARRVGTMPEAHGRAADLVYLGTARTSSMPG